MGFFRVVGITSGIAIPTVLATIVVAAVVGADGNCRSWYNNEPDPATWTPDLPNCPANFAQAVNSLRTVYYQDDACWNGSLKCYLHRGRPGEPSAHSCIRSKNPNSFGASSQCCYEQNGNFIASGTGAGSDDRAGIPQTTTEKGAKLYDHFIKDVVPFVNCCELSNNCGLYLRKRGPRPSSNTQNSFGAAWGNNLINLNIHMAHIA